MPLAGRANAAVGRYAGVLAGIPNATVLLSPLLSQEAVLSSKIEGTQATLGEVLEYEAGQLVADVEKRLDIHEVLNYRKALRHATAQLDKLPLSQRLIKSTHEVLMEGVRGEIKTPGRYRRIQNWLGPRGCPQERARYLPPGPQLLGDLMGRLDQYLHETSHDPLVQLAIVHAEFEAIHPFLDGNGRIGRLLVPLFMVDKRLLDSPDFYVSEYLEADRETYYSRLRAVSADGDWTGWCEYFLEAILAQASRNEGRAKGILSLYEDKKHWVREQTRSQYGQMALDWVFNRPIFQTSDFVASSSIPEPTARRIARVLRDGGLLDEIRPAQGRQSATLMFTELLRIAEG
jgi:Fic family protein